jgi:hypothetical protein
MSEDLARLDRSLAETRGAYFGFQTEAGPDRTDDHGQSPAVAVDRLLDRYAGPESRVLDVDALLVVEGVARVRPPGVIAR